MILIQTFLGLSAVYSGAMYAYLGYRTFTKDEDWEKETFHLALCFILALGFLGLMNN